MQNWALADSTKIVSIFFDGQKKIVTTDAETVSEVLHRTGVSLGSDDLVEPRLDAALGKGMFNINIFRAKPWVVIDGAAQIRLRTPFENPKLIAEAAGLKVYPEDTYDTDVVSNFVGEQIIGQKVTVHRATPVTVQVDSRQLELRSQAATVGGLLQDKHVALGEKDTVVPSLSTKPLPGMKITITRITEAVVTRNETLKRPIKTVEDPTKLKGQSSIKEEGSDGHQTVTYRIHYKNGVETGRETLKVENKVDPTPRVMVIGTKVNFAGSVEYWRPFVEEAASANGVNPNLMLAIMTCESRGNANANNGSAFGLFQYQMPTWLGAGGTRDNIFEGQTQITVTARKIANYGTSPWNASKFCWQNAY